MFKAQCYIMLTIVVRIRCQMEGFIVGGEVAEIEQFPYCAYLSMTCLSNNKSWMCGSSILNQDILLTAAHCLTGCEEKLKIRISAGSVLKNRGHKTKALEYIVHDLYETQSLDNDIALIRMKDRVTFSNKSSRVALMRNPPVPEHAELAGWGLIEEVKGQHSKYLMHLRQTIWKKKDCEDIYGQLTPGKFCAACNKAQYAAPGDSGSALVVNGYIQIGLVSYKKPKVSRYLIVYTNVSYYYDWIISNVKSLYCAE